MSQLTIDGVRVGVTREQYCEIGRLAEAKNKTMEEVASLVLKPKKKAPAKKRARKKATTK